MALRTNQFRQSPIKGSLDLQNGQGNVHNAVVAGDQATPLVAGATVKRKDVFSPLPVVEAAAIGDVAWGVVVRTIKDQDFPAGARLSVAKTGTYVWMEASAAISVDADVQYDPSTGKIATKASTNGIVGQAYDKAGADGDLIRVLVNPRSGA